MTEINNTVAPGLFEWMCDWWRGQEVVYVPIVYVTDALPGVCKQALNEKDI